MLVLPVALDVHVLGVPVALHRHGLRSPVGPDAELGVAEPVGALVLLERVQLALERPVRNLRRLGRGDLTEPEQESCEEGAFHGVTPGCRRRDCYRKRTDYHACGADAAGQLCACAPGVGLGVRLTEFNFAALAANHFVSLGAAKLNSVSLTPSYSSASPGRRRKHGKIIHDQARYPDLAETADRRSPGIWRPIGRRQCGVGRPAHSSGRARCGLRRPAAQQRETRAATELLSAETRLWRAMLPSSGGGRMDSRLSSTSTVSRSASVRTTSASALSRESPARRAKAGHQLLAPGPQDGRGSVRCSTEANAARCMRRVLTSQRANSAASATCLRPLPAQDDVALPAARAAAARRPAARGCGPRTCAPAARANRPGPSVRSLRISSRTRSAGGCLRQQHRVFAVLVQHGHEPVLQLQRTGGPPCPNCPRPAASPSRGGARRKVPLPLEHGRADPLAAYQGRIEDLGKAFVRLDQHRMAHRRHRRDAALQAARPATEASGCSSDRADWQASRKNRLTPALRSSAPSRSAVTTSCGRCTELALADAVRVLEDQPAQPVVEQVANVVAEQLPGQAARG